jgi:hypothetical protein
LINNKMSDTDNLMIGGLASLAIAAVAATVFLASSRYDQYTEGKKTEAALHQRAYEASTNRYSGTNIINKLETEALK